MILKKAGITLLLICSLLPAHKIYAQTTNGGFVPGSIWYSKDPFEEGDKIKIYTFIYNPDKRELSGTVVFFDKNILLAKKDFIVAPQAAKDISVDWTATVGTHEIYAKIENAKFLVSKGKYVDADLAEKQTKESVRTVSKKIIPKPASEMAEKNSGTSKDTGGVGIDSITNIATSIKENTPTFIAKPIIATANAAESFRSGAGSALSEKKGEVKGEMDVLNKKETASGASEPAKTSNPILKPFKYIELFFLSILSFIFNTKLVFYGVILIILFFIARYIWRKFY